MDNNQEKNLSAENDKSKEDMVKEAVEEAKKAAAAGEAREEETEGGGKDCGDAGEATVKEQAETPAEEEDSEDCGEEYGKDKEDGKEKSDSKVKRFGKKNKKDSRDEKIEELTDKLARQMAEFDNFRKRTDKEKSQMYEIGAKDIIEKILPVVDNFERGLESVPEEKKEDPFVQGMDKVYKQLMTTLETVGVKPIEAVGGEFNPDLHNAVMHVEDENFGENIVAEEFQKGYMYRETVVRHSMVKVAN